MFTKIICYLTAVMTLFMSALGLPFDFRYSSRPTELTNGQAVAVEKLETHITAPVRKTRRKVEGTRLFIDNENPLFRFHSFYIDGIKGEDAVKTYESLPEDIREFSAILIGNHEGKEKDKRYKLIDDALAVTDEAGVPVIAEIEIWNSCETYEGFSEEELSSLFENHPSLVGLAHVELFCVEVTQEEIDRLKTSIRVAEKYGGLVVWADSELEICNSEMVFSQILADEELYNLMCNYSRNIIITDKHNGSGRHFAVQSEVIGCWLSGVCDNWGTNIEAWLWWEEGLGELGEQGIGRRDYSDELINHYPPALAGIDTISDLVAGATVYSFEGIDLFRIVNGEIQLNEVWWSVLYPLYQRILHGAIPDKKEVISKIKACYQVTDIKAKELMGRERAFL